MEAHLPRRVSPLARNTYHEDEVGEEDEVLDYSCGTAHRNTTLASFCTQTMRVFLNANRTDSKRAFTSTLTGRELQLRSRYMWNGFCGGLSGGSDGERWRFVALFQSQKTTRPQTVRGSSAVATKVDGCDVCVTAWWQLQWPSGGFSRMVDFHKRHYS